jgi:penicillin-binding protein 1A
LFKRLKTQIKRTFRWPWFEGWRGRDFFKLGFLVAFWSAMLLVIAVFILSLGLPDIQSAVAIEQGPVIIMRDNDGKEFARLGSAQQETWRIDQMSPHLVNAVIAIEDRRFYHHFGVDPLGLARAIYINFQKGGVVQGGSTITQQLAKNLFLTPDRTIMRKVKEVLLALYLERRYSKDQILAAYLNRAYFGAGAYGVEAASKAYFKVSARNLSLPQAALLAGLLKAPSRYSPDNNPKLALERARIVLAAMVDAGYLKPGAEKMEIAAMPVRDYQVAGMFAMRYFSDWIMSQVDGYTGGAQMDLVIDTTLDSALQNFASSVVDKTIERDGEKLSITQGAMIVMTPEGAVRTMIGGRDYASSPYNRAAVAKRQPGSSFKPIMYLAALEKGYEPDTNVLDAPIRVGKYAPENYDGKYRGNIRLQDAVANSLNTVAIRVAQDVGVGAIIRMAQRLGISDPLQPDLSLALGSSEVRMLSLVGAYATLANRGLSVEPYGIKAIKTLEGKPIYQRRDFITDPVLNIDTVAKMNQMLQAVILYGTGQGAMIDRPAAGKTGTSSNFRDAWFMGYTADMVGGVWVGNDDGAVMKRVTGGSVPARIWREVMMQAHRGLAVRPLATAMSGDYYPEQPIWDGQEQQQPRGAAPSQENGDNMFERLMRNLLGSPMKGPSHAVE